MKKAILFLFISVIVTSVLLDNEEKYEIPKENIRYRIIANSNSVQDQALKFEINSKLMPIINDISTEDNIQDVRLNINNAMDDIKNIIEQYTNNYQISFGQNYFPPKTYQGVQYSQGNYESLVISLGAASGDNWWCVLFPPLCLLEAEKSNIDNITYKSYFKKIINKYL